jgi:hypothetical protein
MESALFGMCLIAVVWLIAWAEKDTARPSRYWWPFEMRGFEQPKTPPAPHSWRAAQKNHRNS